MSETLTLKNQPLAQRVAVGQRRVGAQRLVDLDHLAADRHVQVGRGLDRFDDAGDLALPEAAADLGQFDEDDVTQRVLRVDA